MTAILAVGGVLLVSVLTPGPNNLIVMSEAARAGWPAAVRAGLGVLTGSTALLALAWFGVGGAVARTPGLALAISVAGGVYLTFLGVRLMLAAANPSKTGDAPLRGASGAGGLFTFQFLNPKAWVTTLTAASAAQTSLGSAALPLLTALMLGVSAPSLALWSSCGVALTRWMDRPRFRAWFYGATGGLLVVSALLLISSVVRSA